MISRLGKFVFWRLLQALVILVGISFFTFLLLYIIPNDPASLIAGRGASPSTIASIRAQLGLNQPFLIQYYHYMYNLVHGNLGYSYIQRVGVSELIRAHIGPTLELVSTAVFFEIVIGVTIGVISGVFRNSWADKFSMGFAYMSVAAPQFLTGMLLLYVFSLKLGWLPMGGYGGFGHLFMPALTLGLVDAAWHSRVVRSELIREVGEPYVTAAKAHGVSRSRIVLRHLVPISVLPVPTIVGLDFGFLIANAVIVDEVFGWPGVGQLMWQSIQNTDAPIIMGVVLFAGFFIVSANIVADIASYLIDPRIRLG